MAISPPSDLILDVAKAANPAGLQEATSRLRSIAASPTGEGYDLAFAGAVEQSGETVSTFRSTGSRNAEAHKSPAEKFEAMILTQFVETMLPQDAEAAFGEGTTGEIWKSMLAEQVASQLAASGGVGIADIISDTLNQGVKA
ncbi:MAG: rod-binding protein [Roseibium sp.]|uniref:rod-binding protein n=1 Tax=Roseibium sp. TaxID=1936156 RepID=UPI002625C9F5|nr:rod-binding protein [Roseibium sp.]MCV0426740.1 rod-binding protein [Roseibium sp.]